LFDSFDNNLNKEMETVIEADHLIPDVTNGTNVSLSDFNITTAASGPSTLKVVSDVVITTTLVIIMFGMGCTIELWKLIGHLRRPIGAAIGMLAQFIVLPLVTFGFAHALQLEPVAAIGMLVMGSCPGGSTSNIFSYWADGDVPLRLVIFYNKHSRLCSELNLSIHSLIIFCPFLNITRIYDFYLNCIIVKFKSTVKGITLKIKAFGFLNWDGLPLLITGDSVIFFPFPL
jgi:hypothetical protein